MKFFRLDLLTLLISLFILNSCKNPDGVGLGLDPDTQLSGKLIDTSTIVVNTESEIPVITSGLVKTPFGYFNDPVFGKTEANVAVALNLPFSTSYTVPSGSISIDSAVLVLKYAQGFYGDSLSSKYQINVYQLKERVSSQIPYYNNKQWDFDSGALLGSRSFFARTHDTIKINNIIAGKPDSLIKAPPQLRIKINTNFINSILFNASLAQLGSNVVFQNNVKGLYLTLDKAQSTGAGGIFMFGLTDSLNVYYKAVNGTTTDTSMVALPLSAHASQITHTLSETVAAEINDHQGTSRNAIYLQGLAGTRAKISFPFLKNIKPAGGNIVINRAELVVTPVPGSTIPNYLAAQPKLTLYRYDVAKQPVEVPDANPSDLRSTGLNAFGGFYSPTLNSYHFIVTAYIQDLVNGKLTDYGTFLAPVDNTNTSSVDIFPTPQTAGRVIAVGSISDVNSPNYPYRIKLNIIYTKTK